MKQLPARGSAGYISGPREAPSREGGMDFDICGQRRTDRLDGEKSGCLTSSELWRRGRWSRVRHFQLRAWAILELSSAQTVRCWRSMRD